MFARWRRRYLDSSFCLDADVELQLEAKGNLHLDRRSGFGVKGSRIATQKEVRQTLPGWTFRFRGVGFNV